MNKYPPGLFLNPSSFINTILVGIIGILSGKVIFSVKFHRKSAGYVMFDSILKAFGMDYNGKLKKEKQEYLSKLPTPSSRIVICSPEYGKNYFACEVVVNTCDLLKWLQDHYSRCSVSFDVAVFLEWLPTANLNDERLTYLNNGLYSAIEGYEEHLIKMGQASITCGICKKKYKEIISQRCDQKKEGRCHSGAIIWKCPAGDVIYERKYKYNINID